MGDDGFLQDRLPTTPRQLACLAGWLPPSSLPCLPRPPAAPPARRKQANATVMKSSLRRVLGAVASIIPHQPTKTRSTPAPPPSSLRPPPSRPCLRCLLPPPRRLCVASCFYLTSALCPPGIHPWVVVVVLVGWWVGGAGRHILLCLSGDYSTVVSCF